MRVVRKLDELKLIIANYRKESPGKKIGFVPTMGALHKGHLSLLNIAAESCELLICSIFVNPTQFNDSEDLLKYPRTIEEDIKLLEKTSCNILYQPFEEEIYPSRDKKYEIDLEGLDLILEGKFRPGHFDGVAMVVERFFEIVCPDRAFFGEKDFQQLAIIRKMNNIRGLNIDIIGCPIVRSEEGLALSSRNSRLSSSELKDALHIINTLKLGKELSSNSTDAGLILNQMIEYFEKGNLKLEYLEIVDGNDLSPVKEIDDNSYCCVAAYCGDIRLIDNMKLK